MSLTHSSPIAYLYFVLDIIIVGLNTAEVYMIWKEKIGKTFSKLFLVNLSSSDLIVGVCLSISDTMYFLMARNLITLSRDFVVAIYVVAESIVLFACFSSLTNLCTLTIDRLIGVCKPVEYRNVMTRQRALIMILVSWLLSLAATVATTVLYQSFKINIVLHVMLFGVISGSLFLVITYTIIFVTVRRQRQMFPRHRQDTRNGSQKSCDQDIDAMPITPVKKPSNFRLGAKNSLDPLRAIASLKKRMPGLRRQDMKLLRVSTGILVSFFACWWPVTIIHLNVHIKQTMPFEQGVAITVLMQLNSILNSIVYFKWRERGRRKDSTVTRTIRLPNTAASQGNQPLIVDSSKTEIMRLDSRRGSSVSRKNGIATFSYSKKSSDATGDESAVGIRFKCDVINREQGGSQT